MTFRKTEIKLYIEQNYASFTDQFLQFLRLQKLILSWIFQLLSQNERKLLVKSKRAYQSCKTKNVRIFKLNYFRNKEESPPMQNKLQMKQRKKTKAQQMVSSRVNVNLSNENSDSNENESYKVQGSGDDYFLDGLDDMNDLLVINLRLHWLLKTKKNGKLNFSKTPQENDSSYPLLQKVKVMKGLKTEKNPLFWTIEEVYWFIRNISPLPDKGIAKTFRQEEVDGAALVNLKKADLIKYLKVGVPTAQTLAAKIAQLRHETIQKFVNLE